MCIDYRWLKLGGVNIQPQMRTRLCKCPAAGETALYTLAGWEGRRSNFMLAYLVTVPLWPDKATSVASGDAIPTKIYSPQKSLPSTFRVSMPNGELRTSLTSRKTIKP